MKILLTLIVILFTSAVALAQNPKQNDKVDAFKMDTVMVGSNTDSIYTKKASIDTQIEVVRLYRTKNYRVIKELTFIIKTNSGKLA